MAIWQEITAFWRAFRSGAGEPVRRHGGHSLAKTLEDSTHVRGGHGSALPRAGTEGQHKIVAEGHEDYTKSFEDDD